VEVERQHYNVTLAILTLAGIAFALQQTMVIPALPTLQRDLHTTTTWVTWVLTVFLLVASVATPILGKLGDQYGKERLLVISLALFFIGSLGAAAAWNIWSLIGWRAVQGAGAAVFPLSYGIIRDEFPREKVGVAIGLVSAVFGIGGGFGIVLSGVIVDHLSWRWLFIVGAVGIGAALVLVHRFIPESPIKTPSRVDYVGATLMSGGLIAMLVALTEGEQWGWTSGRTLGLAAAAVVLLIVWGIAELRVEQPMVDMRMLGRREILFTNITALISGFAMFGTFVLVPNFVETPHGLSASVQHMVHYGFDASATKAGLYLLPSSFALLFAGPLAGLIGRRVGFKWPLAAGMLLVAISAGSLAAAHDKPWQILAAMPVLGVGVGSMGSDPRPKGGSRVPTQAHRSARRCRHDIGARRRGSRDRRKWRQFELQLVGRGDDSHDLDDDEHDPFELVALRSRQRRLVRHLTTVACLGHRLDGDFVELDARP
jgi:EmrB/QacA subfamily drug resistance transporter